MSRPESPSPPFAHRELNGETLLEELARLRGSLVHQRHLDACAQELQRISRGTGRLDVDAALLSVQRLATQRFGGQPALGALLSAWSTRLKVAADVRALADHFQRLARVSAVVGALWQSTRERGRRG